MEYRPYRAASPESSAAAQGVGPLNGGGFEKACDGAFQPNEYRARPVRSTLILRPIWSDERYLVGWLTDAEAALLSDGRRG